MLSDWVWILIIVPLATWRIASIITQEKIFEFVRSWVGIKFDETLLAETVPDTYLAYLFSCLRCMSVWAAIFCLIVFYVFPEGLLPLAVSTIAIGFEEKI